MDNTVYFTKYQFDMLDNVKDVRREATPDHNHAYSVLSEAYFATETWANFVQQIAFPEGYIKIRKRPTNQANKFNSYNWARIYPKENSPKNLAYTVGISAYDGFVIKIDTVHTEGPVRTKYEQIRGDFATSRIVAILPREKGLSMDMEALVDWSIRKIQGFTPTYDQIHEMLWPVQDNTPGAPNPDEPQNRILYGPPGTGKTYRLQELRDDYRDEETGEPRYVAVTFHQSYGYEEFIEGLRPVLAAAGDTDAGSPARSPQAGSQVRYEIRKGTFLTLCDKARENPGERYACFIDEINRGNISKIFGELITLIETDKRDKLDGSHPPFEVTLPYSGRTFSVPVNVDIYGSMNTADRSLALMDTALRRRFKFEAIMPELEQLKETHVVWQGQKIDLQAMLATMNERIEALYDRDHTIGHGYFMRLKGIADGEARFKELASIFRNNIVPLLEEYFFEEWQKIRLVLADNRKPQDTQFIRNGIDGDTALTSLFGNNHDLTAGTLRPRFTLQQDAFDNPLAYVGIYQPPAA